MPDSSRLVRKQFYKKKNTPNKKHPQSKRPANLNFRLPESTFPKSCKQVLNNFAVENSIYFCPLFVLNFAVVTALLALSLVSWLLCITKFSICNVLCLQCSSQ